MDKAVAMALCGVVVMVLMGRELLKAYHTDSTPFARSLTVRVHRKDHPVVFWLAAIGFATFFVLGLAATASALIFPDFYR